MLAVLTRKGSLEPAYRLSGALLLDHCSVILQEQTVLTDDPAAPSLYVLFECDVSDFWGLIRVTLVDLPNVSDR